MNAVLKKLILKRFRSIPSGTIDFENPTFLVGRNGSGKSNLVDAFAFLAELMVSPLLAAFDRRGGITAVRNRTSGRSYPPNLGICAILGPINGVVTGGRYAFEVRALPNYGFDVVREQCIVNLEDGDRYWFDRTRSRFDSNVRGMEPASEPSALVLPVVGGDVRFAPIVRALSGIRTYLIEPDRVRQMQDPDSGTNLKPDGSNVASVLQEIERQAPEDIEQICDLLASVVPNTRRVKPIKYGNKLSLEFTQELGQKKRRKLEAFNMSDGTLRALGLLVAVFQRPTPTLLALEEPEATIHPGALGAILDLLFSASDRMQVLVTTRSPEVLDAKWLEARNIQIVEWTDGASRIAPLAQASHRTLHEHLMGAGELLRSDALDAEPLFDDPGAVARADLFEALA